VPRSGSIPECEMRIAWRRFRSPSESTAVTATALPENASAEAAPGGTAHSRSELGRIATLGAALVVGLPGVVGLSRLLTTIVLSLILGH
jgi:hypothetical protein